LAFQVAIERFLVLLFARKPLILKGAFVGGFAAKWLATIGKNQAFQADDEGSIPFTRSNPHSDTGTNGAAGLQAAP